MGLIEFIIMLFYYAAIIPITIVFVLGLLGLFMAAKPQKSGYSLYEVFRRWI